jgi:hypothetical protein
MRTTNVDDGAAAAPGRGGAGDAPGTGTGAPAAYLGMVVAAGGTMVLFPLFPALQDSLGLSTGSLGVVAAAGFAAALVTELLLAAAAAYR